MKKYQLKYYNGKDYLVFVDSNKMSDILDYVRQNTTIHSVKLMSLWMDGKVLN
jgi:hypothetical protein